MWCGCVLIRRILGEGSSAFGLGVSPTRAPPVHRSLRGGRFLWGFSPLAASGQRPAGSGCRGADPCRGDSRRWRSAGRRLLRGGPLVSRVSPLVAVGCACARVPGVQGWLRRGPLPWGSCRRRSAVRGWCLWADGVWHDAASRVLAGRQVRFGCGVSRCGGWGKPWAWPLRGGWGCLLWAGSAWSGPRGPWGESASWAWSGGPC